MSGVTRSRSTVKRIFISFTMSEPRRLRVVLRGDAIAALDLDAQVHPGAVRNPRMQGDRATGMLPL